MKLKIDFKNQLIRIGKEDRNYFHYYLSNYAGFLEEYSKIFFKMRKYFAIDDFNYTDLIGYLICPDDPYFQDAPGLVIIFNFLDLLDSLGKISELEVEIDDFFPETFKKCLSLASAKKGWKTRVVNEDYIKKKLSFAFKSYFLVRNALKARLMLRYALGKTRLILRRQNRKRADVLCLSNLMYTKGHGVNNSLFGHLVMQLNKEKVSNKILGYDGLDKLMSSNLLKNILSMEDAYIGDYYTIKHFTRVASEYKSLRQRWLNMKDKQEFKNIFIYHGYNFYELIKPRLELLFNALSYVPCDNKAITKSIIKAEHFKVLCIEHEENMYAKGFMLNMRKSKEAKVVALSHEIISDESVHLHFRNKEVLDRSSVMWRPLPDKKLVWGQYAKDKLVGKCNYPGSIIRITGYPKFDSIFNNVYDKKTTLEKIGIRKKSEAEKKREIVFLAEQTNIDISLPKFYIEAALKNPQMDFIVKPHPSENMADIHKKFAKKPKNLYVLDKWFNIYEVMSVSDYVVVRITTAGFEAMLMGKIVFVFNPRKEHLTGLPYAQSGAAIGISSSEELTEEIRKLQNHAYRDGQLKRTRLFTNFIQYKNDGKASERVVDEIMDFL